MFRVLHRLCLAWVALVVVVGCRFPELPPLEEHAIGGTLSGLWTGAQVTLEMTSSDVDAEALVLTADGPFSFVLLHPATTSFSIEIQTQPSQHNCVVDNGTGTVGDEDNRSASVSCVGPIAIQIDLLNPLGVDIDTTAPHTVIPVSLLQQRAQLVVTAPGASSIRMNATEALLSTVPSQPFDLVAGDTEADVTVESGELSKIISLTFTRSAITTTQEYKVLKASDVADGDRFGHAVAAFGQRILVGAPYEDSAVLNGSGNGALDAGAAYVFTRSGSSWTEETLLKRCLTPGCKFGGGVAMSSSMIAIGAEGDDVDHADSGSVYLFSRLGVGWLPGNRIVPLDPAPVSGFGHTLVMTEDLLVVGSRPSSVHVFRGPSWTEERVIRPTTDFSFPTSMAISGETLVVGAYGDDSAARGVSTTIAVDSDAPTSGAVYVFRRDGGLWTIDAFIKSSNSDMGDHFGEAVSFDGEQLAIGAPGESSGSTSQTDNTRRDAGAAYVFTRNSGTWRQEAYIKPPTPEGLFYFGITVAIRGDMLAVGEFSPNGRVHLYHRDASGTWTWVGTVDPSNGTTGDYYSSALELSYDGLFASSPFEDSDGNSAQNEASPNSGAAYLIR